MELEIIKTLGTVPINVALLYIVWRHGNRMIDLIQAQLSEINRRLDAIAEKLDHDAK